MVWYCKSVRSVWNLNIRVILSRIMDFWLFLWWCEIVVIMVIVIRDVIVV